MHGAQAPGACQRLEAPHMLAKIREGEQIQRKECT